MNRWPNGRRARRTADVRFNKVKKKVVVTKLSPLKAKLDAIFSRYIRLRDMISPGYCRCITCGAIIPIKEAHNGHFMSRTRLSTRFNEANCNAQCKRCNIFKEGEHYIYGVMIDKKHGAGTAERLYMVSKKMSKFQAFEYEEMIKFFTAKVKEMGGDKYW